jgi:hypothetical protein
MNQGGNQCNFKPSNAAATISTSNPVTYIAPNDVKTMMATLVKKQVLAITITSVSNAFYQYR